jgi:hypothetical protein
MQIQGQAQIRMSNQQDFAELCSGKQATIEEFQATTNSYSSSKYSTIHLVLKY